MRNNRGVSMLILNTVCAIESQQSEHTVRHTRLKKDERKRPQNKSMQCFTAMRVA